MYPCVMYNCSLDKRLQGYMVNTYMHTPYFYSASLFFQQIVQDEAEGISSLITRPTRVIDNLVNLKLQPAVTLQPQTALPIITRTEPAKEKLQIRSHEPHPFPPRPRTSTLTVCLESYSLSKETTTTPPN